MATWSNIFPLLVFGENFCFSLNISAVQKPIQPLPWLRKFLLRCQGPGRWFLSKCTTFMELSEKNDRAFSTCSTCPKSHLTQKKTKFFLGHMVRLSGGKVSVQCILSLSNPIYSFSFTLSGHLHGECFLIKPRNT